MIDICDLSFKGEKNKIIINNISCKIKKAELVGILGHNGAGKTTLFRLLMRIYKANQGYIKINIENKKISYVPEEAGIYLKLSAMQNLMFRGRLSQIENIKEKAEDILREIGLEKYESDKNITHWSNGMKKRLSIACGLITNPELLLLDEPTNGIDPESLDKIEQIIKNRTSNGTTILISSHDLTTLQQICTRYIILKNGNIIFDGTIGERQLKEVYLKQISGGRDYD